MAFNSIYNLSVKHIQCLAESDNDQATPADEVYFLADAFDPAGKTGHLASRVYKDVNSGQSWDIDTDGRGYQDGKLDSTGSRLVWPHVKISDFEGQQMLSVMLKMWEEDNGDYLKSADKYFDKQYKKLLELEKTNTVENGGFMQSAWYWGNFSNRGPAGEQMIWKEINRFFSEDVLDLGDDFIGSAGFVITDIDDINNRFYIKFGSGREGWHSFGSQFSIYIDGGSEGRYTLFLEFDVTKKGTDHNIIEKEELAKREEAESEEKQAKSLYLVLAGLIKGLSDADWDVVFPGGTREEEIILSFIENMDVKQLEAGIDAVKKRKVFFETVLN